MLVKEMIKQLNILLNAHGNLPVYLETEDFYSEIEDIEFKYDSEVRTQIPVILIRGV